MKLLFKCVNCNSVLRKDTKQIPNIENWALVKSSCPQCQSNLVYFVGEEKPIQARMLSSRLYQYSLDLANRQENFQYRILSRVLEKANVDKTPYTNNEILFQFYQKNINKSISYSFENEVYVQVNEEEYLIPKWCEASRGDIREGYYLLQGSDYKFTYAHMEVICMFIYENTNRDKGNYITVSELCEHVLILKDHALRVLNLLVKYRYVEMIDNRWVRVTDNPEQLDMISKILYQVKSFYLK